MAPDTHPDLAFYDDDADLETDDAALDAAFAELHAAERVRPSSGGNGRLPFAIFVAVIFVLCLALAATSGSARLLGLLQMAAEAGKFGFPLLLGPYILALVLIRLRPGRWAPPIADVRRWALGHGVVIAILGGSWLACFPAARLANHPAPVPAATHLEHPQVILARALAAKGAFQQALAALAEIQPDKPTAYLEARQARDDIYHRLLGAGEREAAAGRYRAAIRTISLIPNRSTYAGERNTRFTQWRRAAAQEPPLKP